MAAVLSATHLLRRFLLFALTVLFLLTMLRAGHALWHFPKVASADALLPLFLQGLRFDLALVGLALLPPLVVGTLLGMFGALRGLARWFVVAWLMLAMALVLLGEFVTPVYLIEGGLRPGLAEWLPPTGPVQRVMAASRAAPIPMALGALLVLLVLVAFWKRLEVERLLAFPLGKVSSLALLLFGTVACAAAIWSGPVIGQAPLSRADATISEDETVNALVTNTGWTMLEPALDALPNL